MLMQGKKDKYSNVPYVFSVDFCVFEAFRVAWKWHSLPIHNFLFLYNIRKAFLYYIALKPFWQGEYVFIWRGHVLQSKLSLRPLS